MSSPPKAPNAQVYDPANQRNALAAGFLGWTLDAFDFFVLTFVLVPVARDFHVSLVEMAATITASLAMRPVGAFFFGLLADRYGRRWPLMLDIVFYSVVEVLSGLAPNYQVFFVLAPALWNRNGRRMGRGSVTRHGIGFPQMARHPVGTAAGRLCVWKPPGGGGLFPGLPALGLARACSLWGDCPPCFRFSSSPR